MYPLRMARQAHVACVLVMSTLAGGACTAATRRPAASTSTAWEARTDAHRAVNPGVLARDPRRRLVDVIAVQWPLLTAPSWTRQNVPSPENDAVGVYANGQFIGGLGLITDVTAGQVARVRRLTPGEEFMTYGRRHAAGALVIDWATTRR